MVRSDKRRAIIDGALAVFARDGYTRASIDAISAEAGVSTRTVYNHFTDKAAGKEWLYSGVTKTNPSYGAIVAAHRRVWVPR